MKGSVNSPTFIIQLVGHKDGKRSEPFTATISDLNKTLKELVSEKLDVNDYILLVAALDDKDEEEGMLIPTTPLISIERFLGIETEQLKVIKDNG